MSVLVEMKVAGWSWALLPKAPHSFWSYQQKSLLFQQWFPWQCSQSRKERGEKKVSDISNASYIGKNYFLGRRIHGAYPLQERELLTAERGSLAEGGDTPRCQPFRDHEGRKSDGVWSKHWRAAAARVTRVHGTGTGAAASPCCQPMLPAHAASPCWGRTTAHSCPLHCPPVPCRGSAAQGTRAAHPGVTETTANTPPHSRAELQHQHSPHLQLQTSHDSCVPLLKLFRKKLYLVIIRNTS